MKVFHNATFVSCEKQNRLFKVLVEDGGRIVYCGDSIPEKYGAAEKVDLGGKCVVPAFADTHMHFGSWALFNSTVDVREAKNFDEMGAMLKKYADTHPSMKFIMAFGCTAHTVEEKRLPNRDDLDKYVKIPLMIVKYDGHASVGNSALIDLMPERVTSDPGFHKDTGWFYQNAFYGATNVISAMVPIGKLLNGMIMASNKLAERGYGLVHTVEGVNFKNDLDVKSILTLKWGFPSAYRLYFQTMDVDKAKKFKGIAGIGGCFSLAIDGCFGSEDAALFEPYCNDPENYGFIQHDQEHLNAFTKKANREGMQITMHAIGDKAVEMALIAYEEADRDFHRDDARHIIIHADLINPDQIARARKLNLIMAVQPEFLDWKQEPGDYLERILGKERLMKMMPLRSMADAGLVITSGSDAPCTLPNPIVSLYNACNHFVPEESLSVEEALKMLTANAAYSSFEEDRRGMLKPGLIADMAVLSKNVLETAPRDLMSVKVERTYLAGKPARRVKGAADLVFTALKNKLTNNRFK